MAAILSRPQCVKYEKSLTVQVTVGLNRRDSFLGIVRENGKGSIIIAFGDKITFYSSNSYNALFKSI